MKTDHLAGADGRFVEHRDELNTLDVFIQVGAVSSPRQLS